MKNCGKPSPHRRTYTHIKLLRCIKASVYPLHRIKFHFRYIATAFFIFVSFTSLHAATKTWTGNISTDWATAGNWSPSAPASGDDVVIPTSPTGGRMPTISADYTVKSITIQAGATLTHSGGVLSSDGGALDISGTYIISSGTFLSKNTLIVRSGGLVTQSGGTIHMAISIGTNPTHSIDVLAGGNINQSAGTISVKDFDTFTGSPNGIFTQSGGTFRLYHDFKNKGTFTSTGGTIEFAGNGGGGSFPVEVTSGNTQFNHVIINTGVDPNFDNAVCSFNVAGNWTNNSTATDLSAKATNVIFNGTGSQTIGGTNLTNFRTLTIDKPSGTATLLTNQVIDNGNLAITGGIFDLGTYTVNRASSGGSMTLSNGCTLKLASNTGGQTGSNFPLNYTSVSLGSVSTVEYYGSNAITQTIYAGTTYGHLTLTNGSGSGSATRNTTATITVNGTLTANSNVVLSPGAANLIAGSGTLIGSGTVQVTRTAATPDFNSQYTITNKTFAALTVDYNATAAQTVNAHNYFNLTISGSRTTSSVTLANSGTIGISGTFTPSASFTSGNYIITSSTVDFNSSSPHNIPAFTFNDLTVSGGGVKTATGVINVNGAFTLSSTVLTTTASNLLNLNDNATATGAALTAYVNGPVRKTGDDAFTFPVGKNGTGYMPVSISAPSVATDAFTAEYMRSSATALGNITAPGLFRVSNCDYWNLDRTTGSSSVDVTLSWNGYSNCNIAAYVNDLATLTVAHFNGTSWDSHGKNSSTGNASSGTITWNAVSTFSPFSLGSTDDYANPLQVQFTSVNAYQVNAGIQVEWTNANEESIAHYEVERSRNGNDFSFIENVAAKGNNGNSIRYLITDRDVSAGTYYYRIKATDNSGHTYYSSIVKLNLAEKSLISFYPSPVRDGNLTLQASILQKGEYSIRVYNMTGQLVYSTALTHNGGAISHPINLPASVRTGLYNLLVENKNNVVLRKSFIVQ